ncbi:DUF1128 domain-containing protein [Priestia megaterium]|uniref:DUF1128 domain-containing protein n=2 Tax=Priestia megaterium TaxID=1404 RepID=UPI003D27D57E
MDLSVKSPENIKHMVDSISEKLRMLNIGAIKAEAFDEEMYEDLKYLYDMVMRKDSFSPSEMQAIGLRKIVLMTTPSMTNSHDVTVFSTFFSIHECCTF